ncbi:MAG: cardiolipin synthase [Oscillospiraceae bacterium]
MKRKLKKILKSLISQKTIIIILLILQVALLIYAFLRLNMEYRYINAVFTCIALIITIYILNKHDNPAYKIAWIIPLLLVPLFATAAYFLFVNQYGTRKVRARNNEKFIETKPYLRQSEAVAEELKKEDMNIYHQAQYVNNYGGYPIYQNSSSKYLKVGEEAFEVMKEELKKAKHFIFLEYFIIDQGEMWSEILDILLEKVSQGVEVRLMYDGMGSAFILPYHYDRKLNKLGIKCKVFNPFRPFLSSIQNNRDHRKILVIDGHTAFTGGINLADEYINRIQRFGYWKDTGIMVKGDAAWSFTMMFLQIWEIVDNGGDIHNYDDFRPQKYLPQPIKTDGFVMPYCDTPLDNENIGENIYFNIIASAKKYVYICTPYLILDNEMVTILGYAAKSGVDVKIITPGHADKWYAKYVAWSYYKELISLGVEIYEYDGFNHGKMFVSDDEKAVVGSINLDFRSLYLHFESSAFLYKTQSIADIKADFDDMLKNHSERISLEDCERRPVFKKIISSFLRLFAPLL